MLAVKREAKESASVSNVKIVGHVCPKCNLVVAYRPEKEKVHCLGCRVDAVPNRKLKKPLIIKGAVRVSQNMLKETEMKAKITKAANLSLRKEGKFDELIEQIFEASNSARAYYVRLCKLISSISADEIEELIGPCCAEYRQGQPRMLKIKIPISLPLISSLTRAIDSRSKTIVANYLSLIDVYYNFIKLAMEHSFASGAVKDFVPFERAIVSMKTFEPAGRNRDADNYCSVIINNALVRNGIIYDDSFDKLKTILLGGYLDRDSIGRTEIVILEDKKEFFTGSNCQKCQLCSEFLTV